MTPTPATTPAATILFNPTDLGDLLRDAPSVYAHDAQTIRQTSRAARRAAGKKGSKRTPSVDEMYGELERQGLVKIIRKRGKAPRVVFL